MQEGCRGSLFGRTVGAEGVKVSSEREIEGKRAGGEPDYSLRGVAGLLAFDNSKRACSTDAQDPNANAATVTISATTTHAWFGIANGQMNAVRIATDAIAKSSRRSPSGREFDSTEPA